MLGIYLSGTGNTKHCIAKFMDMVGSGAEMIALSTSEEDWIVGSSSRICLKEKILSRLLKQVCTPAAAPRNEGRVFWAE